MASDEKDGVRIAGAVRGVMTHGQKSITPSPDWDFWQSMRTVEAWQACALSLGLDPDSMPLRPPELFTNPYEYLNFERGCFPSRPVEVQFEKRLRLLDTYVRDDRYFGPDSYPCLGGSSAYDKISLKDFAKWAVSVMKWVDMPAQLVVIAQESAGEVRTPPEGVEGAAVAPMESQKPWLIPDPRDSEADCPWYIPARYFARQLIRDNSALLNKRDILAAETAKSLANAGIFKRGGKRPLSADTVKKAFSNVLFG